MFFHFKIFFQSLFFLSVLEVVSNQTFSDFLAKIFQYSAWISFGALLLVIGYAFRTSHNIGKKASMTPIPVLFFLGSLGLLYFINSPVQEQIFIIASTAIYYLAHLGIYRLRIYEKDETARALVGASALTTIFFFYAAVYGIYLNFVVPLWILMLAFLCVTTLVSFQYLWLIKKDVKSVWNYSLVLGLIMTEIAWVVNFWPFGYLTTGAVTLIFYYVFWDLVQCHFLGNLTKKKVLTNMISFGLLASMILFSSRWLPIV